MKNPEAKITERSPKANKMLKILGIIALVCILLMAGLEVLNRQAQKKVNALYDTTVLDYEAYKSGLNSLMTIYGIWNEQSYDEAEKFCDISAELRSEVFRGYTGSNYKTKPTVMLKDIQYEVEPDNSGIRTYYAVMEITNNDNDTKLYYNVIATLNKETLIDYEIL